MATAALGIDIGSTTTKLILIQGGNVIYEKYARHFSRVRKTTLAMLEDMRKETGCDSVTVTVSGSAGMGMAQNAALPFIQEVYATGEVIKNRAPETNVVIELGGEDAKVIFYGGGVDERMNGSCAGGTGAFIDQMAVLLNMDVDKMDRESLRAERIYPIASRCGVFAKSDIQPLLNQGAKKSDIAASIYQAVVNQTITGLAQGRKISGKVMFLGGPLYYCDGLKKRFCETLGLTKENAVFPEYGLYAVAMGAAMYSETTEPMPMEELCRRVEASVKTETYGKNRMEPLFDTEEEYRLFTERHSRASVKTRDPETYRGRAYLGIDCGSTTTKLTLISEDREILYTYYSQNMGDPVSLVRAQLSAIRKLCRDGIEIAGSAVTGYGEELIRHAFGVDVGVVETMAHYRAARHFRPDVDFILDIGGQDIKCFRIRNGAIDSIMLNEACSSGCGSFIETFARALGYDVAEFAKIGIGARAPVDLGSRCTVFMNSSVKQSQKDGVAVADISAGLSVSVVKNAIYKVIRATSAKELGEHIVVQGGTFHNDAVLRAFEKELGAEVIRPDIAGCMGAFGAAISAMKVKKSTLISEEALESFTHESTASVCGGCANHCHLTVNRFADGRRYITGNRCGKALGLDKAEDLPNICEWKREYLSSLVPKDGRRGRIGMPMALSMFELAPLWYALFSDLGFSVQFSHLSNRHTYEKGQFTIPSDTACYPAKIMHGHVLELLEDGIRTVFYPSLTYNVNEKAGDNHYNCPVVAYYAELLHGNMEQLETADFLYPYLDIDSEKTLFRTLYPTLKKLDETITKSEARHAVRAGFSAYAAYKKALCAEGEKALSFARENKKRIMILAGRPYHVDPEIGHGIDKLACSLGFVVVTEDSVCHLSPVQYVKVLDQWTFHARLYRAAHYAATHEDTQLVQLVSFGCGVDAITTDEVRRLLEDGQKPYTQIKIDEITNLGAVKIRLRSLLGALEEREEHHAG